MIEHEDDKIHIDLTLHDTEYGWQRRWDKFFISATPIWFKVLGWVAMLAGLQFMGTNHKHWLFDGIVGISLVFLWQYFIAVFSRVEIIFSTRYQRLQRVISIIIASGCAIVCFLLSRFAVAIIATSK